MLIKDVQTFFERKVVICLEIAAASGTSCHAPISKGRRLIEDRSAPHFAPLGGGTHSASAIEWK